MNYVAPTAPVLIRADWQRLTQIPVRGQNLRWRDARAFPATTAELAVAVAIQARLVAAVERAVMGQ